MSATLRSTLYLCALCLLLGGCETVRVERDGDIVFDGDRYENRRDRYGDKDYRDEDDGPPPWAPAHGYRRKMEYRYYPKSQVYYNKTKNEYSWLEAGDWKIGTRLPRSIDLGDSVDIELEGDQPWKTHDQVRNHYPPGQQRKKDHPGKGRGRR